MARLAAVAACARLVALLTCAGASSSSSSASTSAPVPPSSAGTGVASSAAPVYCPGLPSGGYDETCSRCVLDAACVLTCDDCGGLQAGDPVSASCDLSQGCTSVMDNNGVLECTDGKHSCSTAALKHVKATTDLTMVATATSVIFLGSLFASTMWQLAVNAQSSASILSLVHISPYHEASM